ncbi:WGxxGxxG-CTERM domain-containing protein [Paenibacillus allorhizosphaerae]|uniref:LPXTG cell wall anchor domain-containing protein n=1 Tax=Paenibacillus allorhizosphaerae TaxID=2849866 RepID=A0ABN7TVG3_9BACL|nr:WGxxGxxG-CTERM domain-containing protein [Paenibacillus allorhizosphaerae]CAG7657269.1 hypothetical protein PAECIP111802_06675 [Paenibacillus allorhizosphaerae]
MNFSCKLLSALVLSSVIAAAPVCAESGNPQAPTMGANGVTSAGSTSINAGSSSYISGNQGFTSSTTTTGYGSTSLFGAYNTNDDVPVPSYGTNTARGNALRAQNNWNGSTYNGNRIVTPYATEPTGRTNWGWLGLLGLLGLTGLIRNRREIK